MCVITLISIGICAVLAVRNTVQHPTRDRWAQIQIGMTETEVAEILGTRGRGQFVHGDSYGSCWIMDDGVIEIELTSDVPRRVQKKVFEETTRTFLQLCFGR